MKKMIISDLDGTLLNSHKQITEKTKDVIRKLTEKGIIFTVASGRSRRSQKEVIGDLSFACISDNGATVYDADDRLLWYRAIPKDTFRALYKLVEANPFLHPVFCGLKTHYVLKSDTEESIENAISFFNGHVILVDSMEQVLAADEVVKLSLHTKLDGSEEQKGLEVLKDFADDVKITLSGDGWVDVTAKGVTKGLAYEKILEKLSIQPEDTVMFGDYINDLEMMECCPDTWCMANGHPDVKKISDHITRFSNEEDGVAIELEEIFGSILKN